MTQGLFITFEGGDGAGKSTHVRFLGDAIAAHGREVVRLREPGGTSIGENLRGIVLNPGNNQMAPECELLVYEAARAQIVAEVIKPALERGAVVICDRFADSTIAYQVHGRGLSEEFVRQANAFACQGIVPDRTIVLDPGTSARDALDRATRRFGPDRLEMEGEVFHDRVNAAFLQMAQEDPERMRLVLSDLVKSVTARRVFAQVADLFPWANDETDCSDAFFAKLDITLGS